jgi:hypothetical protein
METQVINPNEVYSANFKNGARTFFINMLEAKNNAKYVKITESRKVGENEYQKNRITLFQNDLYKLFKVLTQAMSRMKTGETAQENEQGDLLTENSGGSGSELPPDKENNDQDLFPNSGKKWTREDEEKLEFLFKAGKTVEDLTEIFGRKQKGIESRLEKLGLIG